MGEVTHEQVNLMLRLYEERREPRLREARDWFFTHFRPASAEEMMQAYPPGSKENANVRMVTSYWEMVANIVNRELIDEEFFFENSGEQWFVWERMKPLIGQMRERSKNPHYFSALEDHARRLEAWRERRAPGSVEAMRAMITAMAQAPKKTA
jgi:hypothetical protein